MRQAEYLLRTTYLPSLARQWVDVASVLVMSSHIAGCREGQYLSAFSLPITVVPPLASIPPPPRLIPPIFLNIVLYFHFSGYSHTTVALVEINRKTIFISLQLSMRELLLHLKKNINRHTGHEDCNARLHCLLWHDIGNSCKSLTISGWCPTGNWFDVIFP